jgi:hypothetical protein
MRSELRAKALKPATKKQYNRQKDLFTEFVREHFPGTKPEPTPMLIQWFVCHLAHKGLKGNTVRSYVSALSFWAQDLGGSAISEDFHVQQLLKGLDNATEAPDTRIPIMLPVLSGLIGAVPRMFADAYDVMLYQAMFATAFFAFLRVGEMTTDGSVSHVPVLTIKDVELGQSELRITQRDFKQIIAARRTRYWCKPGQEKPFAPGGSWSAIFAAGGPSRAPSS